ncbi:hypothetical protein VB620_10515 [Nodularia harveyana UHCC-0300]|uniref:Uncharacterized protein n=1 Tax=Nodularia harveyana UHCC-0300 TaxID=2974287 RepID=A0ABU5UF13_9CYAN|nr:hypothetical protein [Nodularia harveyana]MEA5581769.1 hypothetical protein [Nodularia harveyana UHCC-0300]
MDYYLQNLKLKTEKLLDKLKELRLQLQDVFLSKLVFIGAEGILPGALLPQGSLNLLLANRQITPILPINHILLDFFTPEELNKQLKFELVDETDLLQVRLILDLPISELQLFKDYIVKEENIIYGVPVLEIWPNFQAEGWNEYYGFYYDAEYGEETFQVAFPNVEEVQKFKGGLGDYQIVRCHDFPKFIECKNSQDNTIGIILLSTPQKIDLLFFWKISIDCRDDYTSVYVNKDNKIIESFYLENLHYQIADGPTDTRFAVLFEHFICESFIPIDKPFPMRTILTTQGSADINQERPIFDGRIYIPNYSSLELDSQESWFIKDLNWSSGNLRYIRLFLKHLTLHLTAHAVKNQVKEIQWCISYPPDFSRRDKYEYAQMWQEITEALQAKTGIKHLCPNINDTKHFRSQSLAFAQYFTDFEQYDLVNTTCIDIGETVSNISIWQDNQLIHQCSLNFGKRHLLSQFIKINPRIVKIFDVPTGWINLTKEYEYVFYDKLDLWLRLESANWLQKKRELFLDDSDFQGLIRLMSIGLAGLYFYVGNILSALHKEGKYISNEITPVYIGGIGSRLLHWLATGGEFNRYSEINVLLSRMMSKGSGFLDTQELTRISQNPQDEVTCGLVLNQTKLQELNIDEPDYLISGEEYEINGKYFNSTSRLDSQSNINQIKIYKLSHLKKFFNDFHVSLKDLKIEGVKPLPGYNLNLETLSQQKLWQNTERELKNSLLCLKSKDTSMEPIFILELKALLRVIAKEWTGK